MASLSEPKSIEECLDDKKKLQIERTIRDDIKYTAIMLTPFIILKLMVLQPLRFLNSYIYSSIEINNKLFEIINEVNQTNQIDSLKIK
jgi:hypothetical protein